MIFQFHSQNNSKGIEKVKGGKYLGFVYVFEYTAASKYHSIFIRYNRGYVSVYVKENFSDEYYCACVVLVLKLLIIGCVSQGSMGSPDHGILSSS